MSDEGREAATPRTDSVVRIDEKYTAVTPKMWAVYGKTYSACERATNSLPAGHYLIQGTNNRGIVFIEKTIKTDELLILPDSASEDIIKGIESFWTKKEHYRRFKFLWKRGVLLWGSPGSGKTSTVQIISDKIIERDGLVIYCYNAGLTIQGLETLRNIEPERPIVVILEDIDSIIKENSEAAVLSLLDGEFRIDNVVFLATTNYPDELDQRIINRPSRFDIVKYIDMPSEEARKAYLGARNSRLGTDELDQWVEDTDGYSIAHLKELISSVEILQLPYKEVLERLDKMISGEVVEETDATPFGFLSGGSGEGRADIN